MRCYTIFPTISVFYHLASSIFRPISSFCSFGVMSKALCIFIIGPHELSCHSFTVLTSGDFPFFRCSVDPLAMLWISFQNVHHVSSLCQCCSIFSFSSCFSSFLIMFTDAYMAVPKETLVLWDFASKCLNQRSGRVWMLSLKITCIFSSIFYCLDMWWFSVYYGLLFTKSLVAAHCLDICKCWNKNPAIPIVLPAKQPTSTVCSQHNGSYSNTWVNWCKL